ncbi:hypothetical protein ZOSMA_9G01150 [Zostera marina]|uniref:HTH myb-type domain-containing protein n=1 Tax=Zostera marina TaxID=29655 RepID=A0A0K9NJ49_ZOSMR|nr:hypothetical protein ZOSMA_9G01150 [Zostera marina]
MTYYVHNLDGFLHDHHRIGSVTASGDVEVCWVSATDGEIEDGRDFSGHTVANYVMALEEEKRKIEPFKRELSLCLQLVTDLINHLKRDLVNVTPVLEHFLPIKSTPVLDQNGATQNSEKETRDRNKMDWMSSAQLWSDNYSDEAISNNNHDETNNGFGRVFTATAFQEEETSKKKKKKKKKKLNTIATSDLSLLTPGGFRFFSPAKNADSVLSDNNQQQQHARRKARRCWSSDLHRRFVSALHQIGGSQAATPKQIRELMKVDGLTNDEVKSHLQKYRLHNRRISSCPPLSIAIDETMVVLGNGGMWVPSSISSPAHTDKHTTFL